MTSTAPTPLQALGELQNRTSYIAAPPHPGPPGKDRVWRPPGDATLVSPGRGVLAETRARITTPPTSTPSVSLATLPNSTTEVTP